LFVIAVLVSVPFAAPAAEPQVEFEVKDGWVEFVLTQDDKPVPDAVVQVYDGNGGKFAFGEPGAEGRGTFPLPSGPEFRVEIKVGGRTADLIRLTVTESRVTPDRVLLSFGLAPCCRVPSRGGFGSAPPANPPASRSFSFPPWAQAASGILLMLVAIVVVVATCRPVESNRNRRNRNARTL
jgi:hypothetical protein